MKCSSFLIYFNYTQKGQKMQILRGITEDFRKMSEDVEV